MTSAIKRLVPRWAVRLYHFSLAVVANMRYGFPSRSLTVLGVTGTDGKTTTSFMVFSILKQAGKKAAIITSAGALSTELGDAVEGIGLHVTTPGPFLTQRLLAQARADGLEYIVLETTSHGLDQYRVWGVDYYAAALTNVTREHLDYHGTYENYAATKAKLFKNVDFSILNLDDQSYELVQPRSSGTLITYSRFKDANYVAEDIQMTSEYISFDVPQLEMRVKVPTIGEYNVSNALAAIALTHSVGFATEAIVAGLANATLPPGRLERIDMGQDFTVYIDFAHTAHSLDTMLKLLSEVKAEGSRLITVFGCAGLRDQYKRYPMGASAGRYADFTVITAEDPRTEDLDKIMQEIAEGIESEGGVEGKTYTRIGDREEAIHYAIEQAAQPGDIVVTTGKAQEGSMCYGTTEYPWDEFAVVRAALTNRLSQKAPA